MFWFYATSFVLWVAIFAIVNLRVFFWIGTHTLNVEYRSVKWWKHTPQLKWAQTHFLEYKWEIVLHFFFFHQTSYAQYKAAPLKVKTLISGPETAWDNILTLIIKNVETNKCLLFNVPGVKFMDPFLQWRLWEWYRQVPNINRYMSWGRTLKYKHLPWKLQ